MGINQIIGMQIEGVIHSLNLGNKKLFYAFRGILLTPLYFTKYLTRESFDISLSAKLL